MRWILAILLPPVAILLCGRPFQAFFNLVLCLLAIVSSGVTLLPGVIWALIVVILWHGDQRERRLVRAMGRPA